MRQVLTSPDGGYYTTQPNEGGVFGKQGDFITSPEITQVFGELIGVWTIAEWLGQGRKRSGIQLMEVGPGKGTLMDDMLRVSGILKGILCFMEFLLTYEGYLGVPKFQDVHVEHRGYLSCGSERFA